MARRGYPPEFRRRVVDLVEGGRVDQEAATHSIHASRTESTSDSSPGSSRHVSSQVPRPITASLRGWESSGVGELYDGRLGYSIRIYRRTTA